MNFLLDFLTLALIVLSAFLALRVRDLISAAVVMSVYSFLMCLLWAEMGAVDVSFTEAAVGAGVSTVFIIATIFKTTRRTSD
jgi:energy-converting hydrogenase B subunit D